MLIKKLGSVFSILVLFASDSYSCGLVWDEGGAAQVLSEKALIVWDSVAQEQHFFRRVDFSSADLQVGFIVPTPSVPVVADADERLFDHLEKLTEDLRPIEYHLIRGKADHSTGAGVPGTLGSLDAGSKGARNVVVRAEYALADYDVKVIEATSIEPLNEWLTEKSFVQRPALSDWLTKYIDQKWVFVVFLFRKDGKAERFASKNVRISFKTPQPIYPYREPLDIVANSTRNLKLYFLSNTQYELSSGLIPGWSDPEFSYKVKSKARELAKFEHLFWLTSWSTIPGIQRPDVDLSFQPSKNPSEILLPTNHIYILDDLYTRSQVLGSYILFFSVLILALVLPLVILYWLYKKAKRGFEGFSKKE